MKLGIILTTFAILLFIVYNISNKRTAERNALHTISVDNITIDDRDFKLPIGAKILKLYDTNKGLPYILWKLDNDCFISVTQRTSAHNHATTTTPSKNCNDTMKVIKTIK